MLILLPPSETKHDGGDGPPLDLDALSFPELGKTRARLVKSLTALCERPTAASRALALGPTQFDEIVRTAQLRETPTMPALRRYTGVLYDALDVASLPKAARARADERIIICSALFGLVRATDMIPAYRLSGGNKLPRIGGLPPIWKARLTPVLAALASTDLIIDLRSGAYRSLGAAPGAIDVRVLTEQPSGKRTVVSHFNKHTKGELARLLVATTSDCTSARDVARVARRGGLEVEMPGPGQLDIITR